MSKPETLPFLFRGARATSKGAVEGRRTISAQKVREIIKWADAIAKDGRSHSLRQPLMRKANVRGRSRIEERVTVLIDVALATLIAQAQTLESVVNAQNFLSQEEPANVDQLLERTPIRRLDLLQERLQQRMVTAVLNGTAWLSSAEVGILGQDGATPSNPHAKANRLLNEGKVFAIERAGRKEYPRYEFDALGNPYPVVREVLQVFASWPALRIASWFESASATLDGRRPRELLESDPAAVLHAAKAHVEGPMHG